MSKVILSISLLRNTPDETDETLFESPQEIREKHRSFYATNGKTL